MANPDKWQIENDPNSSSAGNPLDGILVKKTNSGYELYGVLGKYSNTTPPTPPTFNNVSWKGQSWNIVFNNLPVGQNGSGTWTLIDSASDAEPTGTGDESGDFTAQASGGHPDKDAEEAASSASA
jgi:hypothetical protein